MNEMWARALAKMPTGLYILTSCHEGQINGMVASWVTQASYDPPLVVVAVHPERYSHHLIERSGCFALHLLARRQRDLLTRFKGSDPAAKFSTVTWSHGKTGCPVLGDCVAYLECEVTAAYRPGNHTLFVGEVVDAHVVSDDEPLTAADYFSVYLGKT